MGALIGREIIQSRTWDDPKAPPPPNLNFKETFPITVFKAVRAEMNKEDSITLEEILDHIHKELEIKQPIFAAKPANYLMTFAGSPGAVGAIQISKSIPSDPSSQSHSKIPTEKAIGELLVKLGIIDEDGSIDPDSGMKIRWVDIVGRPETYQDLGLNDDGFMTQKATTEAIDIITDRIDNLESDVQGDLIITSTKLGNHLSNFDNPHAVTLSQLNGVSSDAFEFHTDNYDNPHQVSKVQVGLGNVDNTSDLDKPISDKTQAALDIVNSIINNISTDLGDTNFVVGASYNQTSGNLTLDLKDGSIITLFIPINGLIYDAHYDSMTKEFVLTKLSGSDQRVDLKDLFIRYLGSVETNITLVVDGDQITGEQIISATINSGSITEDLISSGAVIERILATNSVTTTKIKDLSITTIKLADDSITTEKLEGLSVTTTKLADRAVTGKKLFSSSVANRVLGVNAVGSDPIWMQVNSDMISHGAVRTNNIMDLNVTTGKLEDLSVTTDKMNDLSVTGIKIAPLAISADKLATKSVTSVKIEDDILLPGTPKIGIRPASVSSNNQIPDTKWVKDQLDAIEISAENIAPRSVDGKALFTSPTPNRILGVYTANGDPAWGTVNTSMMGLNSVNTPHLTDLSVTADKISDGAILSRHLTNNIVQTNNIVNDAVTSAKMWKSKDGNRVLAAVEDDGNPIYTRINKQMLLDNIIAGNHIENRSIPANKLQSSSTANRVMAVVGSNTDPTWTQVTSSMIASRAVNGTNMFTSSFPYRVLAVNPLFGTDPAWLQVTGEMIQTRTIDRLQLKEGSVWAEHLQDKTVHHNHIMDWTIRSNNIAPRAVGGTELFTSTVPNRVLAVTSVLDVDPDWLQVTTDMIEDLAVTKDKLFRSNYSYRVLGATKPNAPPEYLMVTGDFIANDTITSEKLVHNLNLHGTPTVSVRPSPMADNRQIPDTKWVRETIMQMIAEYMTPGEGGGWTPGTPGDIDVSTMVSFDKGIAPDPNKVVMWKDSLS